jgi:hypothetical protein
LPVRDCLCISPEPLAFVSFSIPNLTLLPTHADVLSSDRQTAAELEFDLRMHAQGNLDVYGQPIQPASMPPPPARNRTSGSWIARPATPGTAAGSATPAGLATPGASRARGGVPSSAGPGASSGTPGGAAGTTTTTTNTTATLAPPTPGAIAAARMMAGEPPAPGTSISMPALSAMPATSRPLASLTSPSIVRLESRSASAIEADENAAAPMPLIRMDDATVDKAVAVGHSDTWGGLASAAEAPTPSKGGKASSLKGGAGGTGASPAPISGGGRVVSKRSRGTLAEKA